MESDREECDCSPHMTSDWGELLSKVIDHSWYPNAHIHLVSIFIGLKCCHYGCTHYELRKVEVRCTEFTNQSSHIMRKVNVPNDFVIRKISLVLFPKLSSD
mgnify:CR=1 FL=1